MVIRPLTPALAEIARNELNEDPKRIEEDLRHLKDWIAKQPHLRARTDDQWLVAFLRGCKYSLEKTKEKFDLYYSVHTAASELYTMKHTDPLFNTIINDGGVITLPRTTGADAPRIVLVRAARVDSNKYSNVQLMGSMDLLERIAFMDDDNLMVAGVVIILDLEGLTMAHITQITPNFMKKVSVINQDASPIRMKGVHIINSPIGVENLFNFMKNLLAEKNKHRFYMHSSLEDLCKYIPKDILPAEYGGNGGTTQEIIDHWRQKIKEYNGFLEEEYKFGTDESKRPGKPNTAEDMFGLVGSFRQLEVD